jgi:prepilin-type N-terminal cleavage/methylation domain-containing protein
MRARRCEGGFTLIEVIVVVAIVALAAGAVGTLFLAGASPAVAVAAGDVGAAFAETRQTALDFDAATLVFAPLSAGGYSARIYQRFPGDPAFAPRNGPTYDSAVSIGETAAPLGAPGFAFGVDSRGAVTGYANYVAGAAAFAIVACPASGAFSLRLAYVRDVRVVAIPCTLGPSAVAPVAFATPPPAYTPAPLPNETCPAGRTCSLALVTPAPTPSAQAAPGCLPGAADALGFATCMEGDPIRITGAAVTHQSCGTHVPISDPGPSFTVTVEVFQDGQLWGTYAVQLLTLRAPWLDLAEMPPSQSCGLLYTIAFRLGTITPESENAQSTPEEDTGDPALAGAGVTGLTGSSGYGSDS